MLTTILAFVFAIGLLVFIHEYGHYWVARRCGVGVLTFSIGFGRPIYSWQRGETIWQIAMIPLGGFVRMLDEREQPVPEQDRNRAFNNQHPLKKMAIVLAGPLANLLLAAFLFGTVYWQGVEVLRPVIGSVTKGSLAELAGLHVGDEVVAVAGRPVDSWESLQIGLLEAAGSQDAALQVKYAGVERSLQMPLGKLAPDDFDQNMMARIGVSPFAMSATLADVEKSSPAAKAGLLAGDTVVAYDQYRFGNWSDFQQYIAGRAGKTLSLTVQRNKQLLHLEARIETVTSEGKTFGRLGIRPQIDSTAFEKMRRFDKKPLPQAMLAGVARCYDMSAMTLQMFGRIFTGALSTKQVSGPLGIAKYAGESAALGWSAYVQFLAMISLSLGVLNLLPIPILDGGHLLYHSYELLSGRSLSVRTQELLQKLGLFLLLILMALALYNDAMRFLFGHG